MVLEISGVSQTESNELTKHCVLRKEHEYVNENSNLQSVLDSHAAGSAVVSLTGVYKYGMDTFRSA